MVLSVFTSFAISTSAATTGGKKAATITVTSKANYWYPGASSITLEQEKQTMTFKSLLGNKTKTKSGYYGNYKITVSNTTNKKTTSISWNGGKTKKITLDPDCTYKITVSYDSTWTDISVNGPFGYKWKSTSAPKWKVSSTWKVSSYK